MAKTSDLMGLGMPPALAALLGNDASSQLPPTQYTVVSGNTALILTAAQIAGAADVTIDLSAALAGAGAVTTPTAAQIVAGIPSVLPGFSYRLRIINTSSGAYAWTLNAGTGVTLTGTMSIAQNTWRDFYVSISSTTAVAIQEIGTGSNS